MDEFLMKRLLSRNKMLVRMECQRSRPFMVKTCWDTQTMFSDGNGCN